LGLEALASEALPVKNSGFNDQSIGTVSPLFSTWHMGWPKKWHMALPKSGTSIHVAPNFTLSTENDDQPVHFQLFNCHFLQGITISFN
jgi:hypothetical protein